MQCLGPNIWTGHTECLGTGQQPQPHSLEYQRGEGGDRVLEAEGTLESNR